MKRTDLARKERDIKKTIKKEDRLVKASEKKEGSVGDYISELHSYFFFDETKIYNISIDERITDLIERMMDDLPEKQWETVMRKAVRKTQVKEKESAVNELLAFIG